MSVATTVAHVRVHARPGSDYFSAALGFPPLLRPTTFKHVRWDARIDATKYAG